MGFGLSSGIRFCGDLAAGRVQVGSGVSQAVGAFVATLERHRRRETAPPLAKKPLLQRNRGRPPDAVATCFLLIAASILAARKVAQFDGGKRTATVCAISDASRWAEEIMAEIDRCSASK